ncbi:MAG: hypothetical protein PVG84_13765, partial [Desulfobacterales bacterium]
SASKYITNQVSMNAEYKKCLVFTSLVSILAVFVASTHAYVLQGPHILDLMVENLGKANSLFVSHKIIYYRAGLVDDSEPLSPPSQLVPSYDAGDISDRWGQSESNFADGMAQVDETMELDGSLRFIFSQAFRSDARSNDSERIYIFSGGRSLTLIDGNSVPEAANRFDLYKDILFYHSREALVDRLLQIGVNVTVTSLGRFEEKIAFVIGAQYPDESVSQVWVDQKTFLPLRWIIHGVDPAGESDTLEFRYLIWWKTGKIRYPSRIEFYQDGHLVRVNQAINLEENPTFPKELFDIDFLKTAFPRAPVQPIVPGEPEEPSEVEKTIEEFRRIFE